MTRFFFDLQNGGALSPDEEGIEFATVQDAQAEAVRAITEMAKDAAPTGPKSDFLMFVRGESHEQVFTVALTLKCTRSPIFP
jgi:hypothetical protein